MYVCMYITKHCSEKLRSLKCVVRLPVGGFRLHEQRNPKYEASGIDPIKKP